MKSLKEKQLDFLNDTIAHYNSTNRATDLQLGGCIYSPTETSKGCAIGRHLSLELANELDKLTDTAVCSDMVFYKLPDNLRELRQDFLSNVQDLHDFASTWNKDGLSDNGKRKVENIKNVFELN